MAHAHREACTCAQLKHGACVRASMAHAQKWKHAHGQSMAHAHRWAWRMRTGEAWRMARERRAADQQGLRNEHGDVHPVAHTRTPMHEQRLAAYLLVTWRTLQSKV
eukprot:356543-Chlamydomonas_euryale.AAC.3